MQGLQCPGKNFEIVLLGLSLSLHVGILGHNGLGGLFFSFSHGSSWRCSDFPVAGCVLCRVYMVAIPAVIQAGSEAKLCASLLQPNETLVMTISLMADGQNKTLLHETSDQEFHRCFQFQAPHVKSDEVQNFKVEVRGVTFLSTEERRVMIKPYGPMTFIQTDKPIYNPGQTEHFELKATVFNYLSKCIMVSVTPALSSDYTLTPVRDVQDSSSCLCANGRKTFSWTMAPSVLGVLNVSVSAAAVQSHAACGNGVVNVPERGRVDTVTRSLLVKAEGTEKSHTYNWLLCPTGEALTEEVEVQLPQNVVDGSARISLSVLGDILGRALNNLDGLLQMPYGCGEQNMALLSPNIYILEYLRNTKQLTPAILDKATKFLTSGYQRQLNYKNADGAYSTFGQGLGNTWLTAFVLRSFGKAQSFIYVDPATMEQSKTWLERQQGKHGCFRTLGKLLNNRMKGGVTDEVTLTAYITASMLELNMSVSDPVVDHSLSCLKNSTSDMSNTYATALLAYTFTLAGDMETRARLLQHLDTISFQEGGLLHWSQSSSETSPSLEVEISSYVLLASLSASSRSTSDLGYASRIVRWLVRQQNAYGGFSSTQDTVVALQALALYSTRVFSRGGASTVTVRSPSGERCLFHVNQNNKLLYQERALQDTEGKYSVEVKGSACASVQVVLHYNVPTPTRSTTLSIQVTPEVDCNINVIIPVYRYHGKELTTNMIIVDLKMLSGFSPDPDSLGRVSQVDRVDIKDDHVLMYLTELTSLFPFHITLDIIQELPVQNLKPAVVKIYDYYQPSKLLFLPPPLLRNLFSFTQTNLSYGYR
uniref:Alpha-2-macroglobulin-like n=1 Tax=Salmo trutta TaxID=8032 RepID=A0A673XGY5_SALTR